jgi:hypothetical protein
MSVIPPMLLLPPHSTAAPADLDIYGRAIRGAV